MARMQREGGGWVDTAKTSVERPEQKEGRRWPERIVRVQVDGLLSPAGLHFGPDAGDLDYIAEKWRETGAEVESYMPVSEAQERIEALEENALGWATEAGELEARAEAAEKRLEKLEHDYVAICDELRRCRSRAALSQPQEQEGKHDVGIDCLDGGWRGFQAVCWDCGWRGEEQLRDPDEPMGTEASRSHKRKAREEAAQHREETICQPQEGEG